MTVPQLAAVSTPSAADATLILGPSLGTSNILWDRAIAVLRQHFRIISVDLPGHGLSPAAEQPFSVADLADAVVAVADDAGVDTFYYAGVSLGGQIALQLALRHPDRVLGVSIICSAAKIGDTESWLKRAAAVRAQGTPALVSGSASRWFADGFIAAHPEDAGELLHALSDANDESYALCCEALAASDMREALASIAVPVLALWGDQDVVITPTDARAVAESVRNGRGVEITGAGHLAPIERPDEVAAALLRHFTKD
ncbi:MAG: alpha/beta hydrolase [Homoserinimonas sp.]|nr:alpha/beta hydrolase [Homoserinimonas sp.]